MSDFCEAEHKNTKDGCYGEPNHKGKHWAYSNTVHDRTGEIDNGMNMIWLWGNDIPEVPVGSSVLVLTDAELVALIVALQPVSPYFPGLHAKIEAAREGIK